MAMVSMEVLVTQGIASGAGFDTLYRVLRMEVNSTLKMLRGV